MGYLYRLLLISVISVSAKYWLEYMDMGHNMGQISTKMKISVSVTDMLVLIGIGKNIAWDNISVLVLVSADPYLSNPSCGLNHPSSNISKYFVTPNLS